MKKFLFLAAATSVALVSCVNDETMEMAQEAKKISFDAPVFNTQTRVEVKGEIYDTTYPDKEKFKVYAVQHHGDLQSWDNASAFWTDNKTAPITVMKGADTDHDNHWTEESGKSYYWPKSSDGNIKLTFAAYSPAEFGNACTKANTVVAYAADGLTITNYAVENTVADQIDLMYSDRILNQQGNGNSGDQYVDIKFNHALSSIVFSAYESDNGAAYTIKKVEMKGKFATVGTFKENVTDGATYSAAPAWTSNVTTDETTYTLDFGESGYEVPSSASNFTGAGTTAGATTAILPIPQNVPEDATVTVTYIYEPTNGKTVINTVTKKLKAFLSGTATLDDWKPGFRYIYQFQFGGTPKICFNPSVATWGDGGTYTVEI